MITILFFVLVLTIILFFIKLNNQYWEKRGVLGPKPTFLVGNLGKSFLLKAQPGEVYTDFYREYNNRSIVGLFKSFTPVLLIRDPDLIKEITIKSFHHFRDNDVVVDKNKDPLFGRSPFVLKGDEWKVVRAQLTPGFTSGKMKWIYPYLETNSQKMISFIDREAISQPYEAKELCTRFTLNNVGDAVFGIEAKCFEEERSEFRQLAKEFLSPGSWTVIALLVSLIFPIINKFISLRFCSKKVEKKLTDIVEQTLKYRENNNIVRNDFLHIIGQLKKTSKDYQFTDIDVTAHAAGFFADGYETSSIVMSFTLYLLASNPEAQDKLRSELNRAFEENDNKLPYDILQALPYLDATINESLRVMPPVQFLQKSCTESFTYVPKETNKPLVIEKNLSVVLPIYALQHDPEHFEEPESFKPERFIGANKEKIKKCTFLPFGEGPRACLGQRFGVLQVKVGVSYIIRNFKISVDSKTKLPLTFDATNILITPIGGLWLNFQKIN